MSEAAYVSITGTSHCVLYSCMPRILDERTLEQVARMWKFHSSAVQKIPSHPQLYRYDDACACAYEHAPQLISSQASLLAVCVHACLSSGRISKSEIPAEAS